MRVYLIISVLISIAAALPKGNPNFDYKHFTSFSRDKLVDFGAVEENNRQKDSNDDLPELPSNTLNDECIFKGEECLSKNDD